MESGSQRFTCPVCRWHAYSAVYPEPRSIFSTPLFFQCAKCSLSFVDPKPFTEPVGLPGAGEAADRRRSEDP